MTPQTGDVTMGVVSSSGVDPTDSGGHPSASPAPAPTSPPGPGHDNGCGCRAGDTGQNDPHHADAGPPTRGPSADASVRRARVTDAPAVGLVQAAVWRDTFAGTLPDSTIQLFHGPAFAAAWRTSLTRPPSAQHELMLACAGDQVIGFAAFAPAHDPDSPQGSAELIALGVHPDARGAGHGSRLVNAVVDRAREHGFIELSAWVPLPAHQAHRLLVSAGMGPDGARRERVVDPDGSTIAEVRLEAALHVETAN